MPRMLIKLLKSDDKKEECYMPKKITTYCCEHCNRSYSTQAKAAACEASHYVPTDVDTPEYDLNENDAKKAYPESILVHLKNASGREVAVRYYRR